MKAFLNSLVALVVITAVSAIVLRFVPMASNEVYQARDNVRL